MCVFYFHKKNSFALTLKVRFPLCSQDSSLRVHSSENVSLNARDDDGDVTGRISVGKRTRQSIPLIYDSDGDEGVAPARSCREPLTAKLFLISDISIKHPLTLRPGAQGRVSASLTAHQRPPRTTGTRLLERPWWTRFWTAKPVLGHGAAKSEVLVSICG